MPAYTRETESVHRIRLLGSIRCYWSETSVNNGVTVKMHVETEFVADGAVSDLAIFLVDPKTGRRTRQLGRTSGSVSSNALAIDQTIQLEEGDFDAALDAAILIFEATIHNYRLVGESQRLFVGRPRFSV